jgi:hypothetical protein
MRNNGWLLISLIQPGGPNAIITLKFIGTMQRKTGRKVPSGWLFHEGGRSAPMSRNFALKQRDIDEIVGVLRELPVQVPLSA